MASPLSSNGNLYFAESASSVHCVTADKGAKVYQQPLLADGKLYYVTREQGVFVVETRPKCKAVAHNMIVDDTSVCNDSLAVASNQLPRRSDRYLYCIGKNR